LVLSDDRRTRPVARRSLILAVLFFGAATVVYTFPLALRPGVLLLPGVGDHPSEAALIGWTAHQLLHAPWHLFDTAFFYPHSNAQAYWQSVLVPGIMAMPVMAATGDALLATNAVVLVALTLSGLSAAGLAWSLTRRAAPSVLAGVVFAYFPNRLQHLNTPIVQMGFLLPVILWAYLRFLEEARWRHLLVLVLALWGQSLSSLYYAFAAGFLLLAVGLGRVLLRPDTLTWRLVGRGALGLVALALALAPFLAPYWIVHQSLGLSRPEELAESFGMDLLSWLDPGAFSTLYRQHHLRPWRSEGGLFAGVVVLALAGAAFVLAVRPSPTTRRDRRAAWARAALLTAGLLCLLVIILAAREHRIGGRVVGFKLRIRDATLPVHALPLLAYGWTALEGRRGARGMSGRDWLLVLGPATLVTYLLTLTPTLTILDRPRGTALFHWVYTYVPGAAAFRAPGRWALVFALPLALVAAIGLAALTDRVPRRARGVAAVAVVAFVMVECLPLPIPWKPRFPVPPVHRWLAEQPGDFAVAVLPASDARHAAWAMLWATHHWKRLVNGAFVFVPPTLETLADEEESVDLPALVATLRSIYPLRYVIVTRELLPPAERAAWDRIDRDPRHGVTFVGRFAHDDFAHDDLFSLAGTPQQGVLLRRWFSADFVRRYPLAVYAVALTDAERAARRRIEVRFNGRLVATHETPVQAVVSLESPYRTGDRNELTFTHSYDLDPATTSGPAYRVGRTAAQAPVDIRAVSAANPHGNRASILVNGHELVEGKPRGYVVAALDGRSGKPVGVQSFDTFISAAESRRMAGFIDGLGPGTIVVAAVRDEGGGQLEASGVRALQSIGAREDLRGRLWMSHVVIGVKGAAPGDAVEAAGPRLLEASVGDARPLQIVLESFALR
jgi:Interleukin-like EMT inducer